MKRWMMAALVACASAVAVAQTAPDSQTGGSNSANQPASAMNKPQADTGAAQQRKGPAIPVTLDKSIDAKKAKAGDAVEAKTAVPLNGANLSIPAGSKVIGHITDAKAKSKGDPQSSLTFEFDKIVVKKGQEVPFHAIAQAIGAPANNNLAYPDTAQGSTAPTATAGASGGHAGAAGSGGPSTEARPSDQAAMAGGGGATAGGSGQLGPDATGVVGLKDLSLTSQANSSVVSSDSKSVKLDGGTQMMLRVLPQ